MKSTRELQLPRYWNKWPHDARNSQLPKRYALWKEAWLPYARHVQAKPSFKLIGYDEAHRLQSPQIYHYWSTEDAFFPSRNRQISSRHMVWGKGTNWMVGLTDAPLVYASMREHLKSLALQECYFGMALQQLQASQPHERSLQEHITSLHRGEYLIERGLSPLFLLLEEIRFLLASFEYAPDRIRAPIHECSAKIQLVHQDLVYALEAYKEVSKVRLAALLGPRTLQHTAIMHRLDLPLTTARTRKHIAQKEARLAIKQQRKHGTRLDHIQETELYHASSKSLLSTSQLDAARRRKDVQKVLALSHTPNAWISTALPDIIIGIKQGLDRRLYILYNHTKFHTLDFTAHESIIDKRFLTFVRFRQLLDALQSNTLSAHEIGHHGDHGHKDLLTLTKELQWIRDYRIEKFPESVTQKEINLARDFFLDTSGFHNDNGKSHDMKQLLSMELQKPDVIQGIPSDQLAKLWHLVGDYNPQSKSEQQTDLQESENLISSNEASLERHDFPVASGDSDPAVPALVAIFQPFRASQSAHDFLAQRPEQEQPTQADNTAKETENEGKRSQSKSDPNLTSSTLSRSGPNIFGEVSISQSRPNKFGEASISQSRPNKFGEFFIAAAHNSKRGHISTKKATSARRKVSPKPHPKSTPRSKRNPTRKPIQRGVGAVIADLLHQSSLSSRR